MKYWRHIYMFIGQSILLLPELEVTGFIRNLCVYAEFVVECECTERAGRSEKEQNSFLEDSIGDEWNGYMYEQTWQQCQAKAKNIVLNYRKIMGGSNMHAKQIELFLLFCTLRCFHHELLWLCHAHQCSMYLLQSKITVQWSREYHAIEDVPNCLRVGSCLVMWTRNQIWIRIHQIRIGMHI